MDIIVYRDRYYSIEIKCYCREIDIIVYSEFRY